MLRRDSVVEITTLADAPLLVAVEDDEPHAFLMATLHRRHDERC